MMMMNALIAIISSRIRDIERGGPCYFGKGGSDRSGMVG